MYYLIHYFDPDFNHLQLVPESSAGGSTDLRQLGYVQNVVAGQVLAEIVELDKFTGKKRDPRFIYSGRHLPVGPNCLPHPDNPDKIISAANGYVFYHQGLISVKKLLNVRNNVGFHTGNIFFINDLAVHGDVQTGFAVQAANILVKGHVESCKIKSQGDMVCLGGVKGSNTSSLEGGQTELAHADNYVPSALIEAQGNIRLPFCEHVQLRAGGNVIIDGSCMHSTIYAGGNVVIKGRLQGGSLYANRLVYIEKQMGSDYTVSTRIMMGYPPFEYLKLQKLNKQITFLRDKLDYFTRMAERNEVMQQEYGPRVTLMERKLKIALSRHHELWHKFELDEKSADKCRIVVAGKVMPGCEISIGRAFYKTADMDAAVTYRLVDEEITATPTPPK